MAPQETIEQIGRKLQGVAASVGEHETRLKESEARFARIEADLGSAAALAKESEARAERSWARIEETEAIAQRAWSLHEKSQVRMDRLEKLVDRVARKVEDLTDNWGRFVECTVAPAAETLFAARGIPVHEVHHRVRRRKAGLLMEVDLLVTNDSAAVAIEVKSKLRIDDVDDHLERLGRFKGVYRKYEDAALYGAVAGVDLPENVALYAYRRGLFVLAPAGETMTILNDDRFVPKVW